MIKGVHIMKFSAGRVNAFYTADQQMRESIRQDVLLERYADLQIEMENIENLLSISEKENDETLFEITDMLFDLLESVVPEITESENDGSDEGVVDVDNIEEVPDQLAARQNQRSQKIKQREIQSIRIAKDAEKLNIAKSNINTARLDLKGANSSDAKTRARDNLRKARSNLATAGVKAGTTRD